MLFVLNFKYVKHVLLKSVQLGFNSRWTQEQKTDRTGVGIMNRFNLSRPVGYTTNLAKHTDAFLGKPGSTETDLSIRVKWY
jgi:hypothetical protein